MRKKTIKTFSAFAEKVSNQLKSNDQIRTGRTYTGVVRRFANFLGKEEVNFSDFTPGILSRYQAFLSKEGLTMNTVSYYIRNLRVIYNRAYREGLFKKKDDMLFKAVFTGSAVTEKRALTKKEMALIFNLVKEALSTQKSKEIYESLLYFSFCFHGRGISFIDLCFLRKKHIRKGAIYYCRKKTGKQLIVRITKPMREILDYFSSPVESSPYLFPILNEKDTRSIRAQYENALCKQNRRLKVIGKLAGLKEPLTTHVARHTWATLAHQDGIAVGIISQALGHSDERTTAIYLASFDDSVIDEISERVSSLVENEPALVPCLST